VGLSRPGRKGPPCPQAESHPYHSPGVTGWNLAWLHLSLNLSLHGSYREEWSLSALNSFAIKFTAPEDSEKYQEQTGCLHFGSTEEIGMQSSAQPGFHGR